MRRGERTLRLMLRPIQAWLDDPDVTEICVNQPGELWVEKRGGWHSEATPLTFNDLDAIITLAAALTSQDVGPDQPLCATTLPDGQRVQICREPAVAPGLISMTIRRPSSFVPTVSRLAEGGLFIDRPQRRELASKMLASYGAHAAFLLQAVEAKKNIIIAGATGSGKTTLARALMEAIPEHERLITIEDTPEWQLNHANRVSLYFSRGDQGTARVRCEDLLVASLRMRPDRVLLQELRSGEAFDYLRGVVAGHPGSITTLHAGSAEGAFQALRLMIRQNSAGATLADQDVQDLLRTHIDVVVYSERQGNDFSASEVWWRDQP